MSEATELEPSNGARVVRSRGPYRDYPQDLKAAVIASLDDNGGNLIVTANLFNLPRKTVEYWWDSRERFGEIRLTSSINLADKLENLAHKTVDSMSADNLAEVSFPDKARGLSVIIDKMQLLRGEATSIQGAAGEDRALRLAELLERVRSRQK